MTPSPKKKKQNIKREVGLGGCTVLLMSPLLLLAMYGSIYGFFMGLTSLNSGLWGPPHLTFTVILGMLSLILIGVSIKFVWRLRELYHVQHHLKAEQERVAHLIDTTAAEQRLRETRIASDDTPTIEEKSPSQTGIRDEGLTF